MPNSKNVYQLFLVFFMLVNAFHTHVNAQAVTLLDNTKVTDEAFYFWKANDSKPFHYGASINPHGNCVKVSNGFVFYTWYRGGWSDRTLMVSRKKIGEGSWVHVALPAKLSLVGGKGDTHLTTNIGISPIDGTVHLMFDHHNENLNYIRSKKNIAYGPDSSFTAANFLPQQDYLIPGKVVNGVTYPDLFNNSKGEMYFERRLGSAVGGDVVMTYYNGNTWSNEVTIIRGRGAEVTQGERNFCYGSAYFINDKFYYAYSPRWAESSTRLNEGIYLMELGERMNNKATNLAGESFDLPVIDHAPFFVADPRSVPTTAGWAGGPQVAISPKNDVYMYINPKNTNPYNYLKKDGETAFTEDRNKGSLGTFYGNRMYKFNISGGDFVVTSALAGTYTWREDYRTSIGVNARKSVTVMDNGVIAVVFSEAVNSDKVPIHCFVFQIQKEEYTAQTITFDAIGEKKVDDADFALNATASSGLPVSYHSSNTSIARIVDGNKVKLMGVGSCQISASQHGNGMYDKAAEVSRTLEVTANSAKSNQTISFQLASTQHTWGNPDQTLTATASSGLAVQFESTDTDVAVISNGKLQVKRAGTTTISALQPGNESYNAAPIVSREFVVPVRQQEITFNQIKEVTSGDPAFNLVATSNNPDANLRFLCQNNQVAIVWSNQVRQILGAGSATITVSDRGNAYFTAAQATRTIKVNPKTHQIPSTIEAEYYTSKSGVNVTRWSNTVFYLNAWNANDFAEYTINVPQTGTYEVEIFAASPGSTKKLKLMQGTTVLKSISLRQTPSLTRFLGTKATITLQQGVQKIKVVGEVGGFNFDNMKITVSGTNPGDGSGGGDSEGVYQLVNVATGKYLGAAGSAQPVIMHSTGDAVDRKWVFVKTTSGGVEYYNIDSQDSGILRATGGGFAAGPYLVVSTTTAPPAGDTDKIWTAHYDATDKTFRFEAKDSGRFLYHHEDGNCYNLDVADTDARSKWQVIGTGGSLLSGINEDGDDDGVPDSEDACPDVAGLASLNGCPDDDSDGISNDEDACPNTPSGVAVDAQGCEVFSLPSDNFSIQLLSETCTGKSNGQVVISATAAHEYVATIDGVSYDFTTTTTLSDLAPGTYDLCISVTGKDYAQCYSVTIAGGVSLSGQIQVTGTTAQVALATGTAPFTVFKNGQQVFQTQEMSFSVAVANGDALKVTSKESCEGELTTRVDMLDVVRAYPNPTTGVFTLYVPQAANKLEVEVYNVHSQLIRSGSYDVRGGKVALDIHDAPQGVYFVKLSTPAPVFVKVIKK